MQVTGANTTAATARSRQDASPPSTPPASAPLVTKPVRDTFEAAPPSKSSAPRYEITQGHTLSKADLAQVSKTNPELARSISEAQQTYAPLLAKGAKLVATTSAGNGGKPVLTIVPPSLANNTDPSKPYQVQVHYHGMRGRASKPNADSPVPKRIAESFNQQPPTVFVLPEWKQENDWTNVKNTGTTAADALQGVQGQRARTTVSGHSLGRAAIESAIRNNGLVTDRLDVQDGFYKTSAAGPQLVNQWMKQHPQADVRVLLTTTAMSDKRTIQRQAPLPDRIFVDLSREQDHYDAELKPW
ncbi:MAG TPA: hypothetical protein VFA20_16620 [Myxococcaceae bacterium]|nr:hypothetical protein [Myxococcaceae bacterium]